MHPCILYSLCFTHSTRTSSCYILLLHLVIGIVAILSDKMHVADHKITYVHTVFLSRNLQIFLWKRTNLFGRESFSFLMYNFQLVLDISYYAFDFCLTLLCCKIPINLPPHPAGTFQGPTSNTQAAVQSTETSPASRVSAPQPRQQTISRFPCNPWGWKRLYS